MQNSSFNNRTKINKYKLNAPYLCCYEQVLSLDDAFFDLLANSSAHASLCPVHPGAVYMSVPGIYGRTHGALNLIGVTLEME